MTGRSRERGFTLIAALFVLLVLAALAGYMTTVSGVQHVSTVSRGLGVQAHFAARAGLEWAIGDVIDNGAAGLGCGGSPAILALSQGAAAGFSVSVSCTVTSVTEGAGTYDLYELDATASRGALGDLDYVSRRLIATVTE